MINPRLATQFAYNGDGVRTHKTVGGHSTQYVLDLATTLPVVIRDTDAVYLYGLDIIAQQQTSRYYYMHDGLGSARQLVDTAGQIETNYAYTPFGVPVLAGEGSNPYQFTGEAWDAELELLYLRARYYQPEVGRFVSGDPWPGDYWRPTTLNRYAYVADDPVNYRDPSGLDGWGPDGMCPECGPPSPQPPKHDPQFGGSYVPLESRVHTIAEPIFRGGADWLQAAVESDPAVNRVYKELVITLEMQYVDQMYHRDPARPNRVDAMGFICHAVREARLYMQQYAPIMCKSLDSEACSRLTLRIALNSLAAAVQYAGDRMEPWIEFEREHPKGKISLGKLHNYSLPDIKTRPFESLGWYGGHEEYVTEHDSWWDKSYHFLSHAFMSYESRWGGNTPTVAYALCDWVGRSYEIYAEARAEVSDPAHPTPYSPNDIVANRWGAAFGIHFFDNPTRLMQECYRTRDGCLVHTASDRYWGLKRY